MTLWLMPAPEHVQKFFFSVDDDAQLSAVIDLLQPLRLDGTLQSAIHVINDVKGINAVQLYPWKEAKGLTPLPAQVQASLCRRHGVGAWNASGTLTGTRREVGVARAKLKKRLSGKVTSLRFLDERAIGLLDRFKAPLAAVMGADIVQKLALVKPLFGLNKGIPTDAFMRSTYWRKRGAAPNAPDPEKDRCGQLWLAPVAPARGEHAEAIWRIVRERMRAFGFEPLVSMTLLTGRAIDCVIGIAFDRDVPGEDERALACHDELLAGLTDAGYIPYRLGIASMGRLPEPQDGYLGFHDAIKDALDPARILAPRRYEECRATKR
jgi:4-cresol dehydrogenase (hydroxylating)